MYIQMYIYLIVQIRNVPYAYIMADFGSVYWSIHILQPVTKKFWHFFFDEFCNHFMIGFISAMNNTVAKLLSLLNRWTQPFTQWTIGILKCIEEKVLQPFCDQLYIFRCTDPKSAIIWGQINKFLENLL